jgi:hypothetical protein
MQCRVLAINLAHETLWWIPKFFFHDTSVKFLCIYPLLYAAGMRDVTYMGVYTYLHGKCFLSALYNDIIWLASPQSTLVFVSSSDSVHSRMPPLEASTTHKPTSHFLQQYSVLHVCLCSEHTRHLRCFPLEGQCCECFTSSWLSWDAVGLGLPCEMPLAVTFSFCECIINLRTRSSRKILCVILPPHDLWIRNAFRMVVSVRWKNRFFGHFHVLRAIT